eukprot:1643535-Heterocapsa_arctica.AAC.1
MSLKKETHWIPSTGSYRENSSPEKTNLDKHKEPNILYKEEAVEGARIITTINLSGSQTDYENILENINDHIILIQEHWRVNEDVKSLKRIAFHRGWHGVWGVAAKTQKTEDGNPGRSGGVGIL